MKFTMLILAVSQFFVLGADSACLPLDSKNFERFISQTKSAQFDEYVGKKDVAVRSKSEFEKMKTYIVEYYAEKRVLKSFVDEEQAWDCVMMQDQKGWKRAAMARNVPGSAKSKKEAVTKSNSCSCADGSIPVRRLTLSTLTRFETLSQFFGK